MGGLDPPIHAISTFGVFAWMAGTSPAMTPMSSLRSSEAALDLAEASGSCGPSDR